MADHKQEEEATNEGALPDAHETGSPWTLTRIDIHLKCIQRQTRKNASIDSLENERCADLRAAVSCSVGLFVDGWGTTGHALRLLR